MRQKGGLQIASCFVLLAPTCPCSHHSRSMISATSSFQSFPIEYLGVVYRHRYCALLQLLLWYLKVLLALLWLSWCMSSISKSRSSNWKAISNPTFINGRCCLLRTWAFKSGELGFSLDSTTYLIDQVNFSELLCCELHHVISPQWYLEVGSLGDN